MRLGGIAPTRGRALFILALFAFAVLRFAAATKAAVHANEGDFRVTLPGVFAEDLNPTLWDSPDLKNDTSFHRHGYAYGPTQYLTLFPIVFLDSYSQIAAVLLPIYVLAILATAYLLWRTCELLVPRPDGCAPGHVMTVASAVFLFSPILIALGQREFEIIQLLVLAAAMFFVVRQRPVIAAALLGYVAMFKYWVTALFAYFVVKRQWRAVAAFAAAVVAVLLTAEAVFDLDYFRFANRRGIEQQWGRIYRPLTHALPFCGEINGTEANLHMGLCSITGGQNRLAQALFYGSIVTVTILMIGLFARWELRRAPSAPAEDPWRRVIEFSIMLIGAGVVVHGRYYYLAVLILPLTLLLYRDFWGADASRARLWLGVAAYVVLAAFVLPLSVWGRILGRDPWLFYLDHAFYVYGDAILVGLLVWEYATIPSRSTSL